MPVGYSFPSEESLDTDAYLNEAFEWDLPETYNLAETVEKADETRDLTALIHRDDHGRAHRFTYAELDDTASALGAHLLEAGLESGDRIALCFPQSPELLVAHLATYRIGCLAVPLSVLLGQESLEHSLAHSEASALLADATVYEHFETTVEDADLPVKLVVDLAAETYDGPERHLGAFADHVSSDRSSDIVATKPDEPAIIVYTSGTSGTPKGVVQRHQYLIGTLPGYQCWFHCFGDEHRERVWTPAEWAWAGALFDAVFPTLACGGIVVSSVRRSGFNPVGALALIEQFDVSRSFMPSTAMWQIREETKPSAADLEALEVVMCGGEKLPEPVKEWAERELEIVVNEAYGQTEANALIGDCQALYESKPDSMGRIYPGHECAILDEDLEPVAPGSVGQIALERSDPVLFESYLGDEEATEACYAGDWYLTGDLARMDENGYVTFAGRADDLIISSGYRVSPTAVEAALCRSPMVANAAVGGVSDDERGQRIVAYVLLGKAVETPAEASGQAPIEETLRQHVRDSLGPHKTPHEIEVLEDPPRTRTGKLDRATLFPE
ncbi:AMP-binding protein [Natronolimnobius sp. AArcel1]|uniref:AMP-binding protein n=1 Tax=Natronolimnobius sp. AArcel1 TaxID=1679093 RepID=UPI0013EDB7A4|nr:AMP-binding protein [Natronolimnobius sp. AArcel1]NGM70495.1 AMP-binding protein [Natronolimnobius sp. AArcel1]